jgi:large-conductance mechanosensitive channel
MNSLRNFFNGLKHGFSEYGLFITGLVNYFLLSLVYFIGVGLTAVLAKAAGKHFMKLKKDPSASTYWVDCRIEKKDAEDYYRQF